MLKKPRVTLRAINAQDRDEFIGLVRVSADLHGPWVSLPATPEAFDAYIERFSPDAPDTAEGLLVRVRETGAIAGMINIQTIIRGRFQSGSLGYAAFAPTTGHGYMSEGLGLVLRYAFEDLRLHRLEANIQPGNEASIRLVKRAGFRKEGCAPGMLFIDGAWEDHERWAITSDMVPGLTWTPHPTLPTR